MYDIQFWTGFLFVGDYCLLLKNVGSIVFPAAAVTPVPVLPLLIFHVFTGIRFSESQNYRQFLILYGFLSVNLVSMLYHDRFLAMRLAPPKIFREARTLPLLFCATCSSSRVHSSTTLE